MKVVEIPERYVLTVLLPGPGGKPRAVVIEGRTAKLIAWLVQFRARVERLGVGSLIFNMSLNSFTPEIRDHFPRVLATPEEEPTDAEVLLTTSG